MHIEACDSPLPPVNRCHARSRPLQPPNERLGPILVGSAGYILLPCVDALVRHPRILDAVESLIGPDILVYTSTFFIKEPDSPIFAAWHQHATYFGLTPHEHVTAWVALTDATSEAGCMAVLSSRGALRQLRARRPRAPRQHQRRRPGDCRELRPGRCGGDGTARRQCRFATV